MINEDRTLPAVLVEAHRLWLSEFDHWHDFEPGDMFEDCVQTTEWWRADTNNPGVFGRDGTGGLAAFWIVEPGASVESQPIVFLGSEGEIGVIARNLDDYLWLPGSGIAPLETVYGLQRIPQSIPALVAFAQRRIQTPPRSAESVMHAADALLPALTAFIESVCRYDP